MFERYTEGARRIIFFARYEASQFGSPEITSEHLLLALFREDRRLMIRFLTVTQMEQIRREMEIKWPIREKVSTSVDLPLSNPAKRVLAYAAEEAEAAESRHIGTEHLFVGLLHEKETVAADLLRAHGVDLKTVRDALQSLRMQARRAADDEVGSGFYVQAGWSNVEFYCGKEKLADAVLPALPRIGEHIGLTFKAKESRYRVVDVMYHLESPPSISSAFPQTARTVVIQVEPA